MEECPQNFVSYPNGNVLLRNLNRPFPVVTHGKGVYLYDSNGKRYLDAVSGAFVASVGHGNSEVLDKIQRQQKKLSYINGTQFTSEVTEALATELASLAKPLGLDRSSFLCSGSEAVEAAVKFARQLWIERGESNRTKLIARLPSYHGNTLYALSASGRPHYKRAFKPLLHEVVTISAPYEYRSPVTDYQAEGADYYAKELEQTIEREGANSIFALILEPIIGSSAGASLAPQGYFEKIEAICRKHGILIIADEILSGAGRTGTFFASEHFGLKPDIVVLGKGINGGYAPLSVLMVKSAHLDEFRQGSGNFMHAQTYLQAPCMTAAGLAVVQYIKRHKLLAHATEMGSWMQTKLKQELSDIPQIGFITGKGLLAGIEFVEDKITRRPFEREKKLAEKIVSYALNLGLTLWPNVGHADGIRGDLVMMGPPLTVHQDEIDQMISGLRETLIHCLKA